MELEPVKQRFCRAIACQHLQKSECDIDQCEHPDIPKALEERRAYLQEVKHGT